MESENVIISENYVQGVAELPDCRDRSDIDAEYRDVLEEKVWTPQEEAVDKWIPLYIYMGRSVLTYMQEKEGIPNKDAMENSCTGYAEQYLTDVLHDSEYIPEVALKKLYSKELSHKLITKWTPAESEMFLDGITKYGKDFSSIQKEFLPQKDTKDIVDYYYRWKWTDAGKEFKKSRRQRRSYGKRRAPPISCVLGDLSSTKMVTRSATAAARKSLGLKEETPSPSCSNSPCCSQTNSEEKSSDKRRSRRLSLPQSSEKATKRKRAGSLND